MAHSMRRFKVCKTFISQPTTECALRGTRAPRAPYNSSRTEWDLTVQNGKGVRESSARARSEPFVG